jgi:hypothetical protein
MALGAMLLRCDIDCPSDGRAIAMTAVVHTSAVTNWMRNLIPESPLQSDGRALAGATCIPESKQARLAAEPDTLPARPLKSLPTSVAAESVLCSFSLQSELTEKSFEPAAAEEFAQSAKLNIRRPWAESPFHELANRTTGRSPNDNYSCVQ